jgi:hypothetical protein
MHGGRKKWDSLALKVFHGEKWRCSGFTNSNSEPTGCSRRAGARRGGTVCARIGSGRAKNQQNQQHGVSETPSDGRRRALSARAIASGQSRDGLGGVVWKTGVTTARGGTGASASRGEDASHESQAQCTAEGDFSGGKTAPGGDQGGEGSRRSRELRVES